MITDSDDGPPDDGPPGHARRFIRAVVAVAEFIGPFLPAPLRQQVAGWASGLAALAVFCARMSF